MCANVLPWLSLAKEADNEAWSFVISCALSLGPQLCRAPNRCSLAVPWSGGLPAYPHGPSISRSVKCPMDPESPSWLLGTPGTRGFSLSFVQSGNKMRLPEPDNHTESLGCPWHTSVAGQIRGILTPFLLCAQGGPAFFSTDKSFQLDPLDCSGFFFSAQSVGLLVKSSFTSKIFTHLPER